MADSLKHLDAANLQKTTDQFTQGIYSCCYINIKCWFSACISTHCQPTLCT